MRDVALPLQNGVGWVCQHESAVESSRETFNLRVIDSGFFLCTLCKTKDQGHCLRIYSARSVQVLLVQSLTAQRTWYVALSHSIFYIFVLEVM